MPAPKRGARGSMPAGSDGADMGAPEEVVEGGAHLAGADGAADACADGARPVEDERGGRLQDAEAVGEIRPVR